MGIVIAMALSIPKEQVSTIAKICKLTDTSIEELLVALQAAPLCPDSDELAAKIADRVPSISTEDLVDIVGTVYALHVVRAYSEVGAPKFLDELVSAIELHDDPRLQLTPEESRRVRHRFKVLLEIGKLKTISKGLGLQRAAQHLYCESKIMSDLRPVFAEEAPNPPKRPLGAVITHTLRIGYHERRSHKEFYVVLDSEDLVALKTAVDRARDKDAVLRELLKDSKLENLGI